VTLFSKKLFPRERCYMKSKESKIPQDWFNIAERDLQRAQIMKKAEELKNKILKLWKEKNE
jgi:hypothetical protein